MPFYRELKFAGASVAVWKITEGCEELLSRLNGDYVAEAAALHEGQRRAEWLAVRLLLERLCGAGARIVYDAAGKPLLSAASGSISVSHTRGYAALAYSPDGNVGLDVELVGRNAAASARRFVNEETAKNLSGEDENEKMLAFWCFCEALFKVVGDIGGTYKDNLFVAPFKLSEKGAVVVSVRGLGAEHERDYTVEYLNDGEIFIALCATD